MTEKKSFYQGLPEILNPRGVEMLCQAVLASGIKDRDETFLNGEVIKFYIENGFKNSSYTLHHYSSVFFLYKKKSQKNQFSRDRIPLEDFKKVAYTMSTKKLAERYGKTPDAIRAFCSRHEILRKRKM